MQELVDSLESQLAEKEQLVAALTERLEQAAEQLDRLHRTGADRALRAGFGGMPSELIEQHKKLVEDLQRAVMQWEDMQPGAFFGRLETQLAEVRELVVNLDGASPHAQIHNDHRTHEPSGHYQYASDGAPQSTASLLHLLKPELNHQATETTQVDAATQESTGLTGSPSVVDTALPPLQNPPESIDLAAAERDELAHACEARDAYILYLLERLRKLELIGHTPNSWAGLENVPEEMRARLAELERRLEETLRVAEVELSLQRAKLGREEARIRGLDEQIQKEQRRAHNTSLFTGDAISEPPSADGKGGSRWRRMLGRRPNESS